MKMITKLGFAALITASVNAVCVAQMYGGVHAGYHLATAESVLGTTTTGGASASVANSKANIYGTSGPSTQFGLNFGYMFSEHFGVDIAATYMIGASQIVSKITDANSVTVIYPTKTNESYTASGTQIRVIPSLVVSGGSEGIKPYARFGIVLPVGGETVTDVANTTVITTPLGNTTYNTTAKVKTAGQMSVGFNSAIGVNVGLGEKMTLFGELALTTLSIKAKSSVTTEYASDAPGKTPADRKFSDANINYVDKLDETSNNQAYNPRKNDTAGNRTSGFDDTKAVDDLAKTANYNSFGLNVGLRFKF